MMQMLICEVADLLFFPLRNKYKRENDQKRQADCPRHQVYGRMSHLVICVNNRLFHIYQEMIIIFAGLLKIERHFFHRMS